MNDSNPIVENPVSCMTPPSVDTFDIIDTKDVDVDMGPPPAMEDSTLDVSSSPNNCLMNEPVNDVESSVLSISEHETVEPIEPKSTPSPSNLPLLNEDSVDDGEEDCSCTTTGSRSPTPIQFEMTPKGKVKVISDKESFL